jgi:hypothetical protein
MLRYFLMFSEFRGSTRRIVHFTVFEPSKGDASIEAG